MGPPRTAARPDFHATVQLEMSRRGWGIRTLAKALAGGNSATIEGIELERRACRRWLKGARPSQVNRRRVAVALGLPEETFDDEDEEDALSSFRRDTEAAARRFARASAFEAMTTPVTAASSERRRPSPTTGG